MNVSRRYPARLVLAFAAAALVLVIGAATAFGQETAPSVDPSGGEGISGATGSIGVGVDTPIAVTPPDVAVKSGIVAPAWCCGTSGYVPGLTTYGQATVDAEGNAARDAAIATAVQDATSQANAAADAAGITLGAIIDMQVSAAPYYYPMLGTASGTATGAPGSSGSGSSGSGSSGGAMELAPDQYLGSVSVTITWALG